MLRILLVEPNDLERVHLTRRLQRRGIEVIPAIDGQEALDLVVREPPDLVLAETQLPVLDGYEVARHMKDSPQLMGIPIVALVRLASPTACARCQAAGFAKTVSKPIQFDQLLRIIYRLAGPG